MHDIPFHSIPTLSAGNRYFRCVNLLKNKNWIDICPNTTKFYLLYSSVKIFRSVCDPIQNKKRWHPRWNGEICNLYKDLNIVDVVKIRRLGWVCHIIRMEDERFPKIILNGKFHYTSPVGNARTKWREVVLRETLKIIGIRGWRR